MRIATRIVLGSGVVIVLLAAVTAYEAGTMARLAAMQRALGENTLPATAQALDLLASRSRLEEHLLKFAATRDRRYAEAAAGATRRLGRDLDRLRDLEPSGGESRAIDEVARDWLAFPFATASEPEMVEGLVASDRQRLLERFSVPLDDLRVSLDAVVVAAREQAAARVEEAGDAAARARRLSLVALVVSVVLAFGVTGVTVRSIQRPLGRLIAATEAVAGGRFDHRVPAEGDDELTLLAAHFNSMAERLGELDRLKRDFLSNVSHEIKTPLAAMAETTQLLLDEVPGPLSEKQRRFLELQQQSNRRLQDMIRDLLDLSRHEAGVMEYRFDTQAVRPILEAALAELEPLAGEREVRVELEAHGGLPPVRCDPQRMLQVVLNLLANAIRFSPRGGWVSLAAREIADEVCTWVRVTVGDQGPGVPDPEKAQVFERFHRVAGPRSRDRGGVGLGLAICREIVTAHGGRIGVEDAPGGGAVFVVDLAAATGDTTTPGEREGSA